jgi:hypothetical protein
MPIVPPIATVAAPVTPLLMSTVIDRLYREWLTPSDLQPVQVSLDVTVTDTATALTLDTDMMAPDEVAIISPGTVVEIGLEQMLVTSFAAGTAVVRRGHAGTTAVAHTSGELVVFAPRFSRQSAFDAVADEVVSLHPRLWGRSIETFNQSGGAPEDVDYTAIDVAAVSWLNQDYFQTGTGQIISGWPSSNTGRALIVSGVPSGYDAIVTLKHEIPRPTALTDDLTGTGFRLVGQWAAIVILGAAARMAGYIDTTRLTVDWAANAEQTALAPAGTATALHRRLSQMKEEHLRSAERRQQAEYPAVVSYNDPFNPLTRA